MLTGKMRFSLAAGFTLALLAWNGPLAFDPGFIGFAIDNGDVNGDQDRDLSDPIFLLDHLFLGGPLPLPLAHCDADRPSVENGDSNGDGAIDLSDGVHLLAWLFSGGPAPAPACGSGDGSGGQACRNRIAPPGSRAYGRSLTEWLSTYWQWYLGTNSDPAQATVGNVRLLPIPAGEVVGGSFTPEDPGIIRGSIDVTLAPGTPFVIPLFAWTRETYLPELGIPDDPAIPDDTILAGVSPNLSIDGCTVVSDANERLFYVPTTPFEPIIIYPEPSSYGSIGAIAFQGCGIVSAPLSPGAHEMRLYEPYIIADPPPGIGAFGVVFDNTWRITVGN